MVYRRKVLIFAVIPLFYLLLLLFQKDLSMVGDLGRHLKIGEIVVHCHCVPQTNVFSYTNPAFPIVNHEWLAEVFFYLVSVTFGLSGLLVFKMLLICTTASLVFMVARKKGSLFWVIIFSVLGITIFSMRFFVLPELFSYLMISIFLYLLEKYKEHKNIRLLYLLPLLEILWVNMHLYFIIGIVLYGAFLLERIVRDKKKDNKLFVIAAFLILATLCNPGFIRGAVLPFTFMGNYGFSVEENKSPFIILNPSSTTTNVAYTLFLQIFVFEILAGFFMSSFFFRKRWQEIFSLGSGAVGTGLALFFTRCIGLFSLLSIIPLVQTATLLEEKIRHSYNNQITNIVKGMVILCVFLVVSIHISGLFSYHIVGFGFVPSAEKSVAFMKENHLKGRFFNNYIIGNYLIYAFYPHEQVYIDARPEAYPSSFFPNYWRMMSDKTFFDHEVKKYHINAVIFNVANDDPAKFRPFLLRLLHSSDWVPVYGDGVVTIIVRNNEENKQIIKKYRISA